MKNFMKWAALFYAVAILQVSPACWILGLLGIGFKYQLIVYGWTLMQATLTTYIMRKEDFTEFWGI